MATSKELPAAVADVEEFLITVLRHLQSEVPSRCSANDGYGLLALVSQSLFAITHEAKWRSATVAVAGKGSLYHVTHTRRD